MANPSQERERTNNRITYIATPEGVERAEKALARLGFGSKANFAKSIFISRSTVTKFFGRKPIQLDSFQRICEKLTLDWKEIAELPSEESLTSVASQERRLSEVDEDMRSISTSTRQVVVIDKQNKTTKAVITLQGNPDSISNLNILASILKEYGGDTIVIENIKQGSIKVFISGSSEDIERLKSRIESGALEEINGFPVENIEITNKGDKWHLVEEIVNHPVKGRSLGSVDLSDADLSGANLIRANLSGANLSGANLSGADLSDADLSGADLSGADLRNTKIDENTKLDPKWRKVWQIVNQPQANRHLSDADLSDADLSGADLSGADLSGADLSDADLSDADLSGADLSDADLRSANVENTRFGYNEGIPESLKHDLIERGAIFEDSPGDRSGVLTPV